MNQLPDTFAALSDPVRFAIVQRLLEEGEQQASALYDVADISPPAFSRHLNVLQKAGVVSKRIDKQRRLYAVRPEPLQAISAWTISHRKFWQASLDRLEEIMSKEAKKK